MGREWAQNRNGNGLGIGMVMGWNGNQNGLGMRMGMAIGLKWEWDWARMRIGIGLALKCGWDWNGNCNGLGRRIGIARNEKQEQAWNGNELRIGNRKRLGKDYNGLGMNDLKWEQNQAWTQNGNELGLKMGWNGRLEQRAQIIDIKCANHTHNHNVLKSPMQDKQNSQDCNLYCLIFFQHQYEDFEQTL